ncbi:unnamed protein product [Closterium sp. NIES-53]
MLRTALLASALLPEPPCYAPTCCLRRPAAAHPAARPSGGRPAARAPPYWQPHRCPHRPAHAALLLPALLADPLLPTRRPAARAPPCWQSHQLALPTMDSLTVLTFDQEGRPIQFDMWLDDLQLYLLSNSRDIVSLFDHTSGASLAPLATADSATRSQWLTRDTAARLAVCNHLPLAKRAHFGQHKTAKALYNIVVARYSSPATAALDRLILPYLFPKLSTFATIEDLVTHHRTSDARYRAALPADFLDRNPKPAPDDVRATSALSGKCRNKKGKGGKSGGGGSGGGGGGGSGGGGGGGGGGSGGSGGGSGGFGGGGGGSAGGGGGGGGGGGSGSGGGGSGGGWGGAVQRGGSGSGQRQQQQRRSETPAPQQLRDRAGQTCGKFHSQHHCFSRLDDAWRTEFGDEAERPRWSELLRSGVDIFALDYDAILAAMYALSVSAEGDHYLCVLRDPSIEAAALGASESALPCIAPAEALHTFTLDVGTSRCFFRDSTNLTPLPAPVPVKLAEPSGGPVLARSSTVLPCPAVPSGSLSVLHHPSFSTNLRELICTCARTGRHLATFTCRPGLSPYTLTTEPPQVAASAHVSASGPVAAPCSCRLLSHQTLLWNHRLGHPSLPRLRGMHSRLLVSGLPRSLPPLPPWPALPCLPCVEGRQRAAPHSSSFPPTTAPLQTLHMDDFCRREGILQSFTLPASLQQNGVAERRIGLVMEVARTSMIHAAAPHFMWPFAVRYAAHQLNLWPRVSLPETSPTLRWTGEVGDASVYRVRGSRTFVRDTSADKLSARAIPCVSLGFPPDAPGWQFYHPTSRRALPSHDVTFDESVPFYRLFPYRTAPLPPPPLFLTPSPHPVDPLPPQGPALSGVSQVDPLPLDVPVEVAVDSSAARGAPSRGAASVGAELASAEPGGAEPECAEPGGAESEGAESGGAEPRGPGGSTAGGTRAGGVGAAGARAGDPRAGGTGVGDLGAGGSGDGGARAGDPGAGGTGAGGAGARGIGAGGAGASSSGGARVTAGAGGTEGVGAAGPRGARTGGTGVAGAGGVGGPGGTGARGAGAGGAGVGGTGAGDPGAGGASAGGAGASGTGAGGTLQRRPFFVPPPPSSLPPPDSVLRQTDSLTERRELESRLASPICAVRTGRRVPRPLPPPIPGTHIMALRPSSVPLRARLPSPPPSSLSDVPDPESDLARAASPTVLRLLATVVTDPSFESAAASALVAELSDCPLSVGGECALDTDVLEDTHEDFECLVAAVPHLVAVLLAPQGDPDATDFPTPRSYAEAITVPYSSQRQIAMDAEMASWKSTGTYVDAVPPSGANIVDGMWIFWVKRPPGSPPVFKARYITGGFSQRQGRDYELHSLDFCTTFLQGSLHEEIWLRRPHGFTGSFLAGTQWSLRRPVYSLRQAPREWHHTLRTTFAALGFAPSIADPSLFLRTDTSLPSFFVLVYDDDLVFATADTEALALVKSELQKRHTCTDLGELRSYLGLQITRDRARRTITLTQSHMVHQVLQRFGFRYSSPLSTPLPTGHSLSAPPSELVGCLMYLMTCTRPDLAYPLSILARYVAPRRHRPEHWEVAKRVLRYLCSTSGMGLVLGGRGLLVLTGHADASWVDDFATQRSSQGYTFSLCSGSVSWRSTRSSSVLSSSCEAEIYAGVMAAQVLDWLTYLLTDLGERPRSSPVLYVDNKAMIALCQEHRLEHRMKHIALRYFLARE